MQSFKNYLTRDDSDKELEAFEQKQAEKWAKHEANKQRFMDFINSPLRVNKGANTNRRRHI
jgi:hypothetical protein